MIGKAIKYMRNQKKLNQKQLAELLKIERTTLSGYETERRNPTFELIEKIAKECGYKIYFVNKETNEKFQINELKRKDI